MIDNVYKDKFYESSIDRQFEIAYDGGTITNEMLHSENFELNESLCSETELRFGCCEANSIKFRVSNIVGSLKNKWLTVKIRLAGVEEDAFILGRYKVYSDTPTADRSYRDIVAYDKMYEIINKNVATWYNGLTFPMTLKTFRDSFCNYVGIMQEDAVLVNDSMQVERTIEGDEISGKDILTAICEINGVFGNVGRDGKLKYVALDAITSGLYPANDLFPANNLYPRVENTELIKKAYYKTCDYEDFITRNIQNVVIRMEKDDVGCTVGTDGNTYVVENNFLVFGKSAEVLNNIGNNLLSVIRYTAYRPFNAECVGNPCIELGDKIRLHTKTEVIETYLLNRVMRGIQAFFDSISADGVETYSDNVNSLNRQIARLQGKTVELKADSNGIKASVENLKTDTSASLEILDGKITSEVTRAQGKENELSSSIIQTATEIRSEVKNVNDSLSSSITQTADSIKSTVQKNQTKYVLPNQYTESNTLFGNGIPNDYAVKSTYLKYIDVDSGKYYSRNMVSQQFALRGTCETVDSKYQTQISQTADDILLNVSENYETSENANKQYESFDSRIKLTSKNISLSVNNGDTTSSITLTTTKEDGTETISTGKIQLNGLVSFTNLKNNASTTFINGGNIITNSITANKLSFTPIENNNVIASINASEEALTISSDKINLTGVVTIDNIDNTLSEKDYIKDSDLGPNGTTVIDGGRITTSTIDVNKLNFVPIKQGEVSAAITSESGNISIKSNRLSISSTNFTLTSNGTVTCTNANVSGEITSTKGKIGGFSIGTSSIYNEKTSLTNNTNGVYIGTDGISLGTNTPFKVTSDGTLNATKGVIGSFTMDSSKLYSGNKTTIDANYEGVFLGTDGIALGGSNKFKVTKAGVLTCKSGTIGGFTIDSTKLYAGSKNTISANYEGVYIGSDGIALGAGTKFQVTKSGSLTCSDVSISGNGSINFSYGSNSMSLDYSGISFGNNTEINSTEIAFGNSKLDQYGLTLHGNNWFNSYIFTADRYDGFLKVGTGYSQKTIMQFDASSIQLLPTVVTIGASASGSKIGFFGNTTGYTKQTVSSASQNISSVTTQLNNLINALKNYGLIS